MRASGILLPVSSLNNKYGIGTFGKEAYAFVDFLAAAGQRFWQILPLGPTSYGDSPYQTFSVFAGNPYFIDFELLELEGLLLPQDYKHLAVGEGKIDYLFQYNHRFTILRKAFKRFVVNRDYEEFINRSSFWLEDYVLFMAIKKHESEKAWDKWQDLFKCRDKRTISLFKTEYDDELEFWRYIQYTFYQQWLRLKQYANNKGIEIIGDLPIYIAYDSCELWSNPSFWQLDDNLVPLAVAGCPPDAFAPTGQLWGNPLYNYDKMKTDSYSWWTERFRHAFELYDYVRVDHFRGFESYYSIPYPANNARAGTWIKGPGLDFFQTIEAELGPLNIIAEDLGFLTDAVYKLRNEAGYMGMQVLQFAFDHESDSNYLPHNHLHHSVCYTGTHDNLPSKAWFKTLNTRDLKFTYDYLGINNEEEEVDRLVKAALASVTKITIIPFQDYLSLGVDARINKPATIGGNWVWRISGQELTKELAQKILYWTKLYRR